MTPRTDTPRGANIREHQHDCPDCGTRWTHAVSYCTSPWMLACDECVAGDMDYGLD